MHAAVLGRGSTDEEREWLASDECPGWARSQSAAEQTTLTYWHGRGLGDPIRFLLEFAGVQYNEKFVRSKAQFQSLKDAGALAFGQVPLLETGGLLVVQTQAILRHIAREKSLLGATATEAAMADMVVNAVLDCRMGLITARLVVVAGGVEIESPSRSCWAQVPRGPRGGLRHFLQCGAPPTVSEP